MGRVAIRTVSSCYGFMKVAVVVNISANVPVADQAVACWLDPFLFMQTGRHGSVGFVALETSAIGRAAVGDTVIGDVKVAVPALNGGHPGWFCVGVMTVLALEYEQGRVRIFTAGNICVTVGTRAVPQVFEEFIAGR